MPTCAIAYSGRGRLAAAVAQYLLSRQVSVIGFVDRASANRSALESLGIPVHLIRNTTQDWLTLCRQHEVKLIVLAGFLALVPREMVAAYPERILNSHPALLPAFGGKGMYGRRVHEAVAAAGAAESGFTVHWVSEHYDEGPILYQLRLPVAGLSAEEMERFIQAVEREIYPALVYRVWREKVAAPDIL